MHVEGENVNPWPGLNLPPSSCIIVELPTVPPCSTSAARENPTFSLLKSGTLHKIH